MDSPPIRTIVLTPRVRPNVSKASAIWSASSRVGASTSARGPEPGRPSARAPAPVSRSIVGIANAAVLPVPVWAQPMRSAPSRIGGIARAWIGVGVERSEEHTSELQSQSNLVCRLLLEKKKKKEEIIEGVKYRLQHT